MDTFDNYGRIPEQPEEPSAQQQNPFSRNEAFDPAPSAPEAVSTPDPYLQEPAPTDPVPQYGPVAAFAQRAAQEAAAREESQAPASEPYRYVPQNHAAEPYRCVPQNHAPEAYRYIPQAQNHSDQKKSSPYASSPYVNYIPREDSFQYQPQTRPSEPKKPKAPRKKTGAGRRILAAVLVLALITAGCMITAYSVDSRWQAQNAQTVEALNQQIQELDRKLQSIQTAPVQSGTSVSGSPASTPDGLTPAQVYSSNVDSVVAISVAVTSSVYGQTMEGYSSGSGFILTEDGYVVTNYHVVEGGSAVTVILNDKTELEAAVVGYDSANDVAVLKVDATGLPAVTLGSSSNLIVGDMVVAIGNPLGQLSASQTVGYICGKDREVTTGGTIINMLQTDAAINSGNSGGPLFNMKGEVVGITTAKYSGTTSSGAVIEGIGFAIPIDDVLGIISDLRSYGYVTGAYLGVTVQNVDSQFSAAYGISGACVIGVEKGYSADRAGIRPKDIIVGLNGAPITSITDLTRGLRNYKAGDTVTLTLIRNNISMDVSVTLDEKPRSLTVPEEEPDPDMPSEGSYEEWFEYFNRRNED